MTDRVITPEMAVTLHAEGIQRRELPAFGRRALQRVRLRAHGCGL